MPKLLVRNRVKDYATWRRFFDHQVPAALDAGLRVINVWQETGDPDTVFFLMHAQEVSKALEFMNAPESERIGEQSGVIDGEFYFLEDAE